MKTRILSILLVLAAPILAADRLMLCGWDELFLIDPAAEKPAKLWSWKAKDRPEIPEDIRKTFGSTDDCKPVDDGKRLLVSSSSGGCALLELPSGKALWWARVPNAHSIEALPGNRIAVAASVGAAANKLVVFDRTRSTTAVTETPLPSGHGLVWDEGRKRLWALGMKELRAYSLKDWDGEKPALALESSHPLPDDDGHDLRAIPGGADLILSTDHGVWLFDREKATFRPHPELGERRGVKCLEPHPATGQLVVIQAAGGNWWTDKIERASPAAPAIRLENERLYKGRWCTAFPATP